MPVFNKLIYNGTEYVLGGGGNIGEPLNLSATSSGTDAIIKREDNEIGTIPPTSFVKSELVRKVGSAPSSPSDGDLVVTETVKDTYKTNGYVDQGLTDGTTYYYRVFSYSDLGGISYCDAVSVTPSPWQPGADCVAYFPFDTDMSDQVGSHTITVVQSGIQIDSVDGITALYNSGSGLSKIDLHFTKSDVTSGMFWIKFISNRDSCAIGAWSTSGGDEMRVIYNRDLYTPYGITYNRGSTNAAFSSTPFSGNWQCIGFTETSSGGKLWVDGVEYTGSGNNAYSNLTVDVGLLCLYSNGSYNRPMKAYMSQLSLYNAEITQTDYNDFFNATKADYGIS